MGMEVMIMDEARWPVSVSVSISVVLRRRIGEIGKEYEVQGRSWEVSQSQRSR